MHALDEQRLGRREAMGVLDATALLEHQWGAAQGAALVVGTTPGGPRLLQPPLV